MKLLPYYFKWIGIILFPLGMIFGIIDSGRHGFLDARYGYDVENFQRILPEIVSQLADYATLVGLLIYILAKNKTEDELAQKLRYESAFLVLILTIGTVLVIYIFNSDFEISPSIFLALQMAAYLILRTVKKRTLTWEDDEEQS